MLTLFNNVLAFWQDLQLYLLQLVQALKYEDFDEICSGLDPRSLMLSVRSFNSAESFPSPDKSELADASSITAGINDPESPIQENVPLLSDQSSAVQRFAFTESSEEYSVDLPTFLIQRACANSALANYFYWYLMIECEDPEPNVKHDARVREMYLVVMKKFLQVSFLVLLFFVLIYCKFSFICIQSRPWQKAKKIGDVGEPFSVDSSSFLIDSFR